MRKALAPTPKVYSNRESRVVSLLMLLFSLAIATFLALTLVAMAHGQTRTPSALALQYPQIEATQFPRIVSYVAVTDSASASVGGLTSAHFIVREDNFRELPVLVEEIAANAEGVSVALALDRSGSMEEEMDDAQNAARTFVQLMHAKDQAALVSFADDVRTDQTFTADTTRLFHAIQALYAQGGTAIYDAAIYCADLLQTSSGRKAIILLTDGLDKDSQATLEQAKQHFTGIGIPIFVIGLGSEVSEANLRALAQSSGGRYYFSPASKQLVEIYKTIAALLHQSYRLTYTTHNLTTDGSARQVRVEVQRNGESAFAENAYRAPEHVPTIALTAAQTPEPGQEMQVAVEIPATSKRMYGLHDLQFVLGYDPRYVRVQTPVHMNLLPANFFGQATEFVLTSQVDSLAGKIFLRFKRNASLAPAEGTGVVARINFRVRTSVPDSSDLTFSVNKLAAYDKNNWPVAVQAQGLTLRSSGVMVWSGDTNNDGVVALSDVTALGWHWALTGPKRGGAENQNAWMPHAAKKFFRATATHADADGSGKIDERDLFPIALNWRKTRTNNTAPKLKAAPAPEGRVEVILTARAAQFYRLQILFQNITQRDLAGMAFRMHYPKELVSIVSVQSGSAWGSAPLLFQNDDHDAQTLAVSMMIPTGELTRASTGLLAEIIINAAEAPQQENFMFNEFVVLSPNGESRELDLQAESFERRDTVPREMILHPAYPNPFRLDDAAAVQSGMKIQYDLPENAAVSVGIYNTNGQRVRLISAVLNKGGRHFLHWEGLSDMGLVVSSGLYLVKIEAAGESGRAYQATQKVTVVR